MSRPWLVADLVPRSDRAYVYLVCGGGVVILVLGALYAIGLRLAHLTTDGAVAAFDLDSEGSIASWFSIVLLACCGSVSLLIGRISPARRGWLWVAAVWWTMSLDEGASLHEAYKELMVRLTGTRLMGDGSIYWVVPYFAVLSAAGCFQLAAMWRTRAAVLCLVAAGASYAIAVAGQLDWMLAGRPALETWLEETCEMTADLLILTSLLLHARQLLARSTAAPRCIARAAA